MPPSRKKSCLGCRAAKAKCSQANPCTRCVSRKMECDYGLPMGSRHHRLLPNPPVMTARGTSTTGGDAADASVSLAFDSLGVGVDGAPQQGALAPGLRVAASPESSFLGFELDEFLSGLASVRGSQIQPLGGGIYDAPVRRTLPVELDPTYRIIIGQLQSYPQKMLSSDLPPFIYPECGNGSSRCSGSKGHQCLPTALATCRTIVAMFETMTMTNHDFIWRTVCTEADRLGLECKNWDCLGTLEALQASLIYLLLCAKNLRQGDHANIGSMVQATRTLGHRIHDLYDCRVSFQGFTTVCRKEWIYRESVRRTLCVLYGMEHLLNVFLREPQRQCLGYVGVPLPCGRELWDPEVPDLEWATRYHQPASGRAGQLTQEALSIGTIQSYLVSQCRTGAGGEDSQLSLNGAVAEWCEGVDELGMLIWMAVMLDLRQH